MSSERLSKLGELAVIAALVAATGYLGSLVHHNYVVHGSGSAADPVRFGPRMIPARGDTGQTAPVILEGLDRPVLLLVMRTTCPFCEENMPGWVELAAGLEELGPDRPDAIVLSVSGPDETRAYLDRHGLDLPVRYIDGGTLPLLGLAGFPSTVAVDPVNRGLAVWEGVLTPADREAIQAWSLPAGSTLPVAGGGGR